MDPIPAASQAAILTETARIYRAAGFKPPLRALGAYLAHMRGDAGKARAHVLETVHCAVAVASADNDGLAPWSDAWWQRRHHAK